MGVNMEEKEGNLSKAAATNFTAFLTFLGSLNFWRGIWSLMDFYFFPSLSLQNNLLMSHVVGFLGTYLAGVSLTLASHRDLREIPQLLSSRSLSTGASTE